MYTYKNYYQDFSTKTSVIVKTNIDDDYAYKYLSVDT